MPDRLEFPGLAVYLALLSMTEEQLESFIGGDDAQSQSTIQAYLGGGHALANIGIMPVHITHAKKWASLRVLGAREHFEAFCADGVAWATKQRLQPDQIVDVATL